MSLEQSGYKLVFAKPNAEGLCSSEIVEIATGAPVAEITRPSTLEEAFAAARKFVEELEKEG